MFCYAILPGKIGNNNKIQRTCSSSGFVFICVVCIATVKL